MLYPTQNVQGAGSATPAKPIVAPAAQSVVPVTSSAPKRTATESVSASPTIAVEDLDVILKEVRANLAEGAANLEISVDQDTGKTIVRVIDEHTQEIIRQIPSEELIAISRSLTKLEGKFLDTKV